MRIAVSWNTHNEILDIDSARPLKIGGEKESRVQMNLISIPWTRTRGTSVVLLRPWIIFRDNTLRDLQPL